MNINETILLVMTKHLIMKLTYKIHSVKTKKIYTECHIETQQNINFKSTLLKLSFYSYDMKVTKEKL